MGKMYVAHSTRYIVGVNYSRFGGKCYFGECDMLFRGMWQVLRRLVLCIFQVLQYRTRTLLFFCVIMNVVIVLGHETHTQEAVWIHKLVIVRFE